MAELEHELSVIELVDTIIAKAITCNASDIHLEPTPYELRLRYRIDGVLYEQKPIIVALLPQVISRIKIIAQCDIAEKRVPQDGKLVVTMGSKNIDLRVSTFPTIYGQKIVIRILDRSHTMMSLDHLGLSATLYNTCKQLLRKQQGFFLVTGPTGSGKTTTLYAALCLINTPEKNIITLEDPVEYNVTGITQGQIHADAGFTFARGVRAMLRQDPDVIMIGEIRDKETAGIAIESALTGHLVLSTLHTNNAPGAIMRLMDMGIEPFLLNAAITGVIAQRLVRKICQHCRIEDLPTALEQEFLEQIDLPLARIIRNKGCEHCFNLGYKGRIGIFELIVMSSELRALIVQQPIFDDIYAQALDDGMHTLLDDAKEKVISGIISLEELMRVLV